MGAILEDGPYSKSGLGGWRVALTRRAWTEERRQQAAALRPELQHGGWSEAGFEVDDGIRVGRGPLQGKQEWLRYWLAPGIGKGDEGRIEFLDGRAAEEAEGAVDAFAEDLNAAKNAGFACGAEPVSVGAPDKNGASAEADGFDDVGAATDSAVEKDFGLTADGGDDFRQDAESWRNGVELAAAVIGNDDGGGADIDSATRVVCGENTFCDDGAGPEFAEPAKIFPSDDG